MIAITPLFYYFCKNPIIMKRNILSAISMFITVMAFPQTSITYQNNALLPGNETTTNEIKYLQPGNQGQNQIWDFSKIQFTGTVNHSSLGATAKRALSGESEFNVVLSESDNDYFFNCNNSLLEEKGFASKDINLTYSDPLVKMKYPFSYGDQFTDKWAGNTMYQNITRIDLIGDYTVTADAFGTLILPDRVLKNTLRIKTEKTSIEAGPCSSLESHTVRYLWYAAQYRFPVMVITTMEVKSSGQEPVITRSAAINLQQPSSPEVIANVSDPVQDNSDVSVIVFPNPFSEKLTYNYFLRTAIPVTVELFDMTGRLNHRLVNTQIQPEGLHTGVVTSDETRLTPGIYYLRFTFDNKVVISKIVKI